MGQEATYLHCTYWYSPPHIHLVLLSCLYIVYYIDVENGTNVERRGFLIGFILDSRIIVLNQRLEREDFDASIIRG